MPIRKKTIRYAIKVIVILFIFMNVVAAFHAYKFTHFNTTQIRKTKNVEELSTWDKIKTLAFGINNPRPQNIHLPHQKFQTIFLTGNKKIACWSINTDSISKGTVIIFHGFSGDKSKMLNKSDAFLKMGYNTFLVDFMGSGASEGNQTTIGFKEAEEVTTCFNYIRRSGTSNIILCGTSMGAVAIMKAVHDDNIEPAAIILECPFGSMYQTVSARFKTMKVPPFPMAGLLVFWGGVENGFWAFNHNPTEYAKSINCPALLLYGEKDDKVSRKEIEDIYNNLKGRKHLDTYPLAGHEDYLKEYKSEWVKDIEAFLINNK